MKNLLLFEFYNIFKRREIKFVLIILFSASIIDFVSVCSVYRGYPIQNVRAFYDQFMLITPHSIVGKQLYIIILPIIVSIIYSDSLVLETKNKLSNYIYIRTSKNKHILAKVIVNFVVVFLSIFICLLINYILVRHTFPIIGGDNVYAIPTSTLYSSEGLKYLYNRNLNFMQIIWVYDQRLFILALIIIKSITGGAIATLSLAISTFFRKSRITSILTSFIIVNFIMIIEQIIGKTSFIRILIDFKYDSIILYLIIIIFIFIISNILIKRWKFEDVL